MKKLLMFLIPLVLLNGCTLAAMNAENDALETRITQKEQQLNEIEQENLRLEKEKNKIAAKLSFNKLTLYELNNEIGTLIHKKERLLTKKKMGNQSVAKLQEEINILKGQQNQMTTLSAKPASDPQKEKQIEQLKEEIKNYLKLGLKPKNR